MYKKINLRKDIIKKNKKLLVRPKKRKNRQTEFILKIVMPVILSN